MSKASDVRVEGSQTGDVTVDMLFLDARDRPIGEARRASPGMGTYNWRPVTLTAIAPEGVARVRIGVLLSVSGEAWFDRIKVERVGEGRDTSGWREVSSAFFKLRFPVDHPDAATMTSLGKQLDRDFLRISRALFSRTEGRIIVHCYRDVSQGRELAGRSPRFADPLNKCIHLRPKDPAPARWITPILLAAWGRPGNRMIAEGLAAWFSTDDSALHHSRAKVLLETGRLPSLADVSGRFDEDVKASRRAAASFIGRILDENGLDVLRSLYLMKRPRFEGKKVLGRHLEQAWQAWQAWLRAAPF